MFEGMVVRQTDELCAVYMMANRRNGALYTGVTAALERRVWEHKNGHCQGFSKRYGCTLLVWYEVFDMIADAIAREKQIKAGSRRAKLQLIEHLNPDWQDLYADLAH